MFDPSFALPLSLGIILAGFLLRSRRARTGLLFLAFLVQVRYLLWRGLFTLDTATSVGIAVTGTLFIAELYGLLQNLFFYYQARSSHRRTPPEPARYPTVDIFVPIVNEPLVILKRTLIGCLAQDYPEGKVFIHVLDDGGRDEVRELSREMGCTYHRREDRAHAKAGNLNHALERTNAELVAVFDVDHVPVRNFLMRTVGCFGDEKVAFVQTPHHFYNPDIYQRNLRLERDIRNDQDLFFKVIQAGRDAHNSAFFAGSSGIFRRAALKETEGFRTETLTEDLHTSLLLHARGWKSCYVNETLSAGLSPESQRSYLKQRERWTMGAVQTFLRANPLITRGLSLAQRIDYLGSIYYFFHGIPRVIYLAAPLAYLFFGVPPIMARPVDLVHYFLSYYFISLFVVHAVGKGYRRALWSDVYETMMCFSLSGAVIRALFPFVKKTFYVTPKGEYGEHRRGWKDAVPHLVLAGALLAGIGKGLLGGTDNAGALTISVVWASVNVLFLFLAVFSSLERPQRRRLLRLRRTIRCAVGGPGKVVSGTTEDISENGVSVRLDGEFYFTQPEVHVELRSSYGEVTRIPGHITRQEVDRHRVMLGIKFEDMAEEHDRSLVRQMYSPPESWEEPEEEAGGFLEDAVVFGRALLSPWKRERDLKRLHPRRPMKKPCTFIPAGGEAAHLRAETVDASYSGLSIRVNSGARNIDMAGDARVEVEGVGLLVAPVAMERESEFSLLHLRVKAIEHGEPEWKTLTLPA
jgi:cellulose synthase (UDP-forming)